MSKISEIQRPLSFSSIDSIDISSEEEIEIKEEKKEEIPIQIERKEEKKEKKERKQIPMILIHTTDKEEKKRKIHESQSSESASEEVHVGTEAIQGFDYVRTPRHLLNSATMNCDEIVESILDVHRETLKDWIQCKTITLKRVFDGHTLNISSFQETIGGESNIIILIVTKNSESFGLFESRKIPKAPDNPQSKMLFSKGKGEHFLFSLDNATTILFRVDQKVGKIGKTLDFKSRRFIGLASENGSERSLLYVNHFCLIQQTGNGLLLTNNFAKEFDVKEGSGMEDILNEYYFRVQCIGVYLCSN